MMPTSRELALGETVNPHAQRTGRLPGPQAYYTHFAHFLARFIRFPFDFLSVERELLLCARMGQARKRFAEIALSGGVELFARRRLLCSGERTARPSPLAGRSYLTIERSLL